MISLPWKLSAAGLLVAGIVAGVLIYGEHRYTQGHAAAVSERTAQDAVAVITRGKDNAALSIKQDVVNAVLTKVKNEELAPVRERIVTQRVYVGAAICGPAAPAEAQSTTGSDRADPPGRLVRSDVERDLVALKLAVEEDLATGRSCQAFITKNGLIP